MLGARRTINRLLQAQYRGIGISISKCEKCTLKRNFGGNAGVLVTASLDNGIGAGEIDVTIDQDGANFIHDPVPYPGDIP
jgi:hypothetical protein